MLCNRAMTGTKKKNQYTFWTLQILERYIIVFEMFIAQTIFFFKEVWNTSKSFCLFVFSSDGITQVTRVQYNAARAATKMERESHGDVHVAAQQSKELFENEWQKAVNQEKLEQSVEDASKDNNVKSFQVGNQKKDEKLWHQEQP